MYYVVRRYSARRTGRVAVSLQHRHRRQIIAVPKRRGARSSGSVRLDLIYAHTKKTTKMIHTVLGNGGDFFCPVFPLDLVKRDCLRTCMHTTSVTRYPALRKYCFARVTALGDRADGNENKQKVCTYRVYSLSKADTRPNR